MMKMKHVLLLGILCVVCGCLSEEPLFIRHSFDRPQTTTTATITPVAPSTTIVYTTTTAPRIKIASWNLQRFGPKKSSDIQTMNEITKELSQYNIIVLQEITDVSGKSFDTLCDRMLGYKCAISDRTGPTTYKEQYGVLYTNDIKLNDDYMIATSGMERFPYVLNFTAGNWTFNLVTAHTKPETVQPELMALEYIINSNKRFNKNTIILGDLNADCDYYGPRTEFLDRNWIIGDYMDTTPGPSDCAYDRMITDEKTIQRLRAFGVDTSSTPKESDHYLIFGVFDSF